MNALGAVAIAALAAFAIGCGSSAATAPVAEYRTQAAAPRDIVIAVESAGVIEPITLVDVKSKASGEILELPADTGAVVDAAGLLVKIDERVPRNTLAQADAGLEVARARLDNARAQLDRIAKLFDTAAVSVADREKAELDVANARAEVVRSEVAVENARIAMEDTVVRAPIAGTIIERFVERGQVISSPTQDVGGGTLLLRMANLDQVQVRALVDETDIGKVEPGIAVEVTVAAYPNRRFGGVVEKIEPQATNQQNVTMFPVLVTLANDGGLLKPGMNAEIVVGIAARRGVLAVPTAALRTMDDIDSAASLLGLDIDTVRADLARHDAGAPRGAGVVAGANEAPPISREAMRDLMRRQRAGGTLTDGERAQIAAMRAFRERAGLPAGGGPPGGSRAPASGAPIGDEPADPLADPLAPARRRSALDAQMGGDYIVFVLRDGQPSAKAVRTGITDLDFTEIVAGIASGDDVLLLPSESLVRSQQSFRDRILQRMAGVPGFGAPSR